MLEFASKCESRSFLFHFEGEVFSTSILLVRDVPYGIVTNLIIFRKLRILETDKHLCCAEVVLETYPYLRMPMMCTWSCSA